MMAVFVYIIFMISSIGTNSQQINCNQGVCPQTINCGGSTNCQLTCNDYGCQGSTINCRDYSQCDIYCSGSYGCQGATINCPINAECNMHCSGANSCSNAQINGADGTLARLTVTCQAVNACQDTTFDARDASELNIQDCSWQNSCIGVTLWCPQYELANTPRCNIAGEDSMGGTATHPISIYAVNGWDDINIIARTPNRYGTMYCKNNYDTSCSIEQTINVNNDPWTCVGGTDCDELTEFPTKSPTNPPTNKPTKNPITSANPTKSPIITVNPTNAPSSKAPTTSQPSQHPSVVPSVHPTNRPTQSTQIGTTSIMDTGILISITFEYKLDNNYSNISIQAIDSLLTNIIDEKIKDNSICMEQEHYDIDIINNDANKILINGTIYVCNESDQQLLIAQLDEKLETEFVDKMKNELNIIYINDNIEVSIIAKSMEVVETTMATIQTIIVIKEAQNEKDDNIAIISIFIIIGIILVCLIMIGAYFIFLRIKKKTSDTNTDRNKIEFVSGDNMKSAEYIISVKTNDDEEGDGHDNTDNTDSDEEMYTNHNEEEVMTPNDVTKGKTADMDTKHNNEGEGVVCT